MRCIGNTLIILPLLLISSPSSGGGGLRRGRIKVGILKC